MMTSEAPRFTAAEEPLAPAPSFQVRRALILQTWTNVAFLHWRYDPAVVRPLVPAELALDLFDGAAWVGLIPFMITGFTVPGVPPIPWISHFPETNVRTYVLDRRGRRGVWFFSLDAARLVAVLGARAGYGLPYFWAGMKIREGQRIEYRSRRILRRGYSDLAVEPGGAISTSTELDLFLTARFRLFSRWFGRPALACIEHQPWPLRRARVVRLEENLVRMTGLPEPRGEPLVHFAGRVDVRTGAPHLAN